MFFLKLFLFHGNVTIVNVCSLYIIKYTTTTRWHLFTWNIWIVAITRLHKCLFVVIHEREFGVDEQETHQRGASQRGDNYVLSLPAVIRGLSPQHCSVIRQKDSSEPGYNHCCCFNKSTLSTCLKPFMSNQECVKSKGRPVNRGLFVWSHPQHLSDNGHVSNASGRIAQANRLCRHLSGFCFFFHKESYGFGGLRGG